MRKTIYETLCACLGLGPGTAAAGTLICPACAEPGPAPQAPRNRNVIYYSLLRDDRGEERPQTIVYKGRDGTEKPAEIRSFLAYRLLVVCYGPDAEKHAHRIRATLYADGAGEPRSILRKAGIYPVPRPEQPLLLTETEDLSVEIRVVDLKTARAVEDPLAAARVEDPEQADLSVEIRVEDPLVETREAADPLAAVRAWY